jgi:hypothetical protein
MRKCKLIALRMHAKDASKNRANGKDARITKKKIVMATNHKITLFTLLVCFLYIKCRRSLFSPPYERYIHSTAKWV